MNKYLIQLLAAMGITLAADATEEQCAASITQATGTLATANAKDEEIATLKREKATADEQLAAANAAKAKADGDLLALANAQETLTTRATAAETALQASRSALAARVIAGAIVAGKIPAAEKDARTLALANAADIDAEVATIDALPSRLRTQSRLQSIEVTGNEQAGRQQTVLALVNAAELSPEIAALPPHARYDAAFKKVTDDPKNAALFGAMKKPEVPAK